MVAKRITRMALLCAIALTIFMLEAQIPPIVPLPGVKLGLANIVTVFAVFVLGPWEAAGILLGRIFLGSVFAGNFSAFFYAAAGGTCAIGVTILLRKVLRKNQIWVAGCLGAAAHGVGQMAAAVVITATPSVLLYLPMLLLCGLLAGLFTGLCAQLLIDRGKSLWNRFLI